MTSFSARHWGSFRCTHECCWKNKVTNSTLARSLSVIVLLLWHACDTDQLLKTVTGSSFMQTTGFKSATLTHSSCIKFTIISINTCSVTFRFFMSREVSKLTEREFAMKQEKVGHARVRARQQQLPPTHPRAIMLANVRLPHMWTNWVHVWKVRSEFR